MEDRMIGTVRRVIQAGCRNPNAYTVEVDDTGKVSIQLVQVLPEKLEAHPMVRQILDSHQIIEVSHPEGYQLRTIVEELTHEAIHDALDHLSATNLELQKLFDPRRTATPAA